MVGLRTLWHYGKQAGLSQLDPKHYGSGLKGDELARILHGGAPSRTYFYTKDRSPEAGLGPHRYTAQVPEADLYDMQADPEGIYAQALQQHTIPERVTDYGTFPEQIDRQAAATAAELELMNRGFKGYIGGNDSAAMFVPTDVQPYAPPQGIMDTLSGYSDEALRILRQQALDEGKADEAASYANELRRRSEEGVEVPPAEGGDVDWSSEYAAWPGHFDLPGRGKAGVAAGVGIMAAGQSEEAEANIFGNVAKNAGKFLTPDEQLLLSKQTVDKFYKMRSVMPSAEEMAVVAKAGQSKKGWYLASAQALVDVFGADAPRFSGLLAALSPQTGVEDNLLNALNVWVNWDMAGRPTDPAQIRQIMGYSVQGTGTEASVLDAWVNNSVRSLSVPDDQLGRLVLSGPKADSFMRNLNGVLSEVTNDTWQANYMGVPQTVFGGNARLGKDLPDVPAYQNLTKVEEMIPGLGARDYRKIAGKSPAYLAANDLTREAAVRLSELTGDQWEPAEIQEAVWSWARTLGNKERKGGPPLQELAAGMQDAEIADTPDFGSLLSSGQYHDILERNPAYEGVLPGLERTHTYPKTGGTFTEEAMALPGGEEHLMNAAGRLSRLGPAVGAGGLGFMAAMQGEDAEAAPMGTLADRIRMATRQAFHGSPHDFKPVYRIRSKDDPGATMLVDDAMWKEMQVRKDMPEWEIIEEFPEGRFDLGKVGTGEGAQAYGWGAYLSSSKGIARGYRDALAGSRAVDSAGADVGYIDLVRTAREAILDDFPNIDSSSLDMVSESMADRFLLDSDFMPSERIPARSGLAALKDKYSVESSGKLYTAEIPAEDHLLDWDKPISGQSDEIKDVAARLVVESTIDKGNPDADQIFEDMIKVVRPQMDTTEMTGQQLYRRHAVDPSTRIVDNPDRLASEKLRELGIPGHTYLGRTSDERNYVMYDDDLINIVNKGMVDPKLLPALAGVGAVGAYAVSRGETSKQPDDFRARVEEFRSRRDKKRNAGKDYLHAVAQTVGDVGSALIGPSIAGLGNLALQRSRLLSGDPMSMAEADANRALFDYEPTGNPLTEKWREDAKNWAIGFVREVMQQQAPQQAMKLAQEYDIPGLIESMGEKYNELPEDVRVLLESYMDATDLVL